MTELPSCYRCGKQPCECGDGVTLYYADCRDVLAAMPESSVHAIVTDPPYGLAFMGKSWDASIPQVWKPLMRVAKPGCHLLAFSGTRTFHRLACALEDAGWEIRDCIMWVYGSGFPKSLDVSKAIDKADPVTPAARKWQGWGTALKPAWEPIIVARKPLAGTVAANVLEHGCGALNIDGCRVPANGETPSADRRAAAAKSGKAGCDLHSAMRKRKDQPPWNKDLAQYTAPRPGEQIGRWPANLVHDGSQEVLGLFPQSDRGKARVINRTSASGNGAVVMGFHGVEGPAGFGFGDSGSAARFFYCAKASRAERGHGNTHPTVKPLALMDWLCRLVSQPGGRGVLLDPFVGSGSALLVATKWFDHAIGIEREEEYCAITANRLGQEMLF